MPPNQELLDEIYRQKILAARKMTPEERVEACFALTAYVRRGMEDGIRDRFPQANEDEVQRILRDQVAKLKRLHERR